MKIHIRIFGVFLACFLSAIYTIAAYNISGSTLAALPPQFMYAPYAGYTFYTLDLNYDRILVPNGQDPVSCKYTTTGKFGNVTWSGTTSVDLPNWVDEANATQNAQNEWNRFRAALSTHENGHVTRANDFKQNGTGKYTAQLLDTTVTGSGDTQAAANADAIAKLDAEANNIWEEAFGELDTLENQYDTDTGHGPTLDTSII